MSGPAQPKWHVAVICFLLLLAAVQCGRACFVANVSYLDLERYAVGTERVPYQDRVAMMPLLRWAERSLRFRRAAAVIDRSEQATPQHASKPEVMGPEKLASVLGGCVSVVVMTFAATWYTRRRFPTMWWLGGVLVLAILFASYAARAELNLWYPYDLPHFAVFGLATLGLLEGEWWLFFLCVLVDIPIRETSVYLLLVGAAVAWTRREMRAVAGMAAVGLLAWLPFRLLVTHHFAQNASEVGVRWHSITRAIVDPLHWPQVASAGGFLFVPLILGRRYLSREQRVFLLAAVPCVLVTLTFGMWYESRIFGEWTVATAVLLADEVRGLLDERWLGTDEAIDQETDARMPAEGG